MKSLARVFAGLVLLFLAAQSPGAWAQAPDPDLNDDGIVNILDISLVGSCFGANLTTMPECDVADHPGGQRGVAVRLDRC